MEAPVYIQIETKNNISGKIKKYIETHPKVLEEYMSNRVFTTSINRCLMEAETDDDAIKHLIEMVFSSTVIFTETLNAVSEVAGIEANKKIGDIIREKIEYFKDE